MDRDRELLEQILNQLISIDKQLKSLKENQSEYHFSIDVVNIHDPHLDELKFQLESLDIKDLSGVLNIGNNFGTNAHHQKKEHIQSDKYNRTHIVNRNGKKVDDDILIKINQKPMKFTFREEGGN